MIRSRFITGVLLCTIGAHFSIHAQDQYCCSYDMNYMSPYYETSTSCGDLNVSLDFIYWKAQEDALEYAMNGLSNANTGFPVGGPYKDAALGSTKKPDFDYQPGFKVGLGTTFGDDGWDVFAQYTWWKTTKSQTKTSVERGPDFDSYVMSDLFCPSSIVAQGYFSGGVGQSGLISYDTHKASGDWSMDFNALDLELGRKFCISRQVVLRPFAGLKFSWIDQKFNAAYEGVFATDTFNTLAAFSQDQYGVGLRAGMDTTWHICNNFAIFGDFALNGLWNKFNSKRKDFFSNTMLQNDPQLITNLKNNNDALTGVFEWTLGLRYETAFCNDYMLMVQVGWEQQIWFNQNRFILNPSSSPANLTFQGLTVEAALSF